MPAWPLTWLLHPWLLVSSRGCHVVNCGVMMRCRAPTRCLNANLCGLGLGHLSFHRVRAIGRVDQRLRSFGLQHSRSSPDVVIVVRLVGQLRARAVSKKNLYISSCRMKDEVWNRLL